MEAALIPERTHSKNGDDIIHNVEAVLDDNHMTIQQLAPRGKDMLRIKKSFTTRYTSECCLHDGLPGFS